MFTNNDGGDISILTSLITSLSVANAIGKNLGDFQAKARKNKKQMMFGFFHGVFESFHFKNLSSRSLWVTSEAAAWFTIWS